MPIRKYFNYIISYIYSSKKLPNLPKKNLFFFFIADFYSIYKKNSKNFLQIKHFYIYI